jgi:hypothetical protein
MFYLQLMTLIIGSSKLGSFIYRKASYSASASEDPGRKNSFPRRFSGLLSSLCEGGQCAPCVLVCVCVGVCVCWCVCVGPSFQSPHKDNLDLLLMVPRPFRNLGRQAAA